MPCALQFSTDQQKYRPTAISHELLADDIDVLNRVHRNAAGPGHESARHGPSPPGNDAKEEEHPENIMHS